jgi:hypothetical protein
VDIDTDVEHVCLLKSIYLGNAAAEFQVSRLTGASFIVSTPTHPVGVRSGLLSHQEPSRDSVAPTSPID